MNNDGFIKNNFKELIKDDPARQKDIARQGGIASGKARRKKSAEHKMYTAIMQAAFMQDFATPEELKAFRKWRQAQKSKKPAAVK